MDSRKTISNASVVSLYLGAIVAANLLAAKFGPSVTVLNAFLFIGLDITARDKLHEAWHGRGLVTRMGALICVGSILSWLLNAAAQQIALASALSFAAASTVDAVAYSLLYRRGWMTKVNGSNIVSSVTDSIIFPTLAFGSFMPLITLGQILAKVVGGAVWAFLLSRRAQ